VIRNLTKSGRNDPSVSSNGAYCSLLRLSFSPLIIELIE